MQKLVVEQLYWIDFPIDPEDVPVLEAFVKHVDQIEKWDNPTLFYDDLVGIWRKTREAEALFLGGKSSKAELIAAYAREDSLLNPFRFYLDSPKAMRACMRWYTGNKSIGTKAVSPRVARALVMRRFKPSNGDPKADVGFSLLVLSDGQIIPTTIPYLRPEGITKIAKAFASKPHHLTETWAKETICEFHAYLRENLLKPTALETIRFGKE